jgi:hypothetical protein
MSNMMALHEEHNPDYAPPAVARAKRRKRVPVMRPPRKPRERGRRGKEFPPEGVDHLAATGHA